MKLSALAVFILALGFSAAPASAQTIANQAYGGETRDWGIPPQAGLRPGDYHAPTPTGIPGGRVVYTYWLAQAVNGANKPLLLNFLTGRSVRAIPGSVWLSGGGQGISFDDLAQERLGQRLAALTGGNKAAPIVMYCLSAECWLSYNATLRALRLGYSNAMWYRGGVEAWTAAGLPVVNIDQDRW